MVLGMVNVFRLEPGYFGYYVLSLWVLFECFVLADSIDGALARIVGGGALLLTGGGRI